MNHADLLEQATNWEYKGDVKITGDNVQLPIGLNDLRCCVCAEKSYPNILCKLCRKNFKKLTKDKQRRIWNVWHRIVCEKGRVGDKYICSYCKKPFDKDSICGDHVLTKGSRPDLKFSILNGVPCCMDCNRSDNPNRFPQSK